MSINDVEIETRHKFLRADARNLSSIASGSVNLVLTSPPYPMIAMWDSLFSQLDPVTARALEEGRGLEAFQLMHQEVLLPVWRESWRVLADGGFICINVGDALRTINGRFRLYPNGPRILEDLHSIGFDILPQIIWRKTTNAPNKFMGSGMLPAGAYVTLEHEHILIARKGATRQFPSQADRERRRQSAIFWEERNTWFSDLWDLRGAKQEIKTPVEAAKEVMPEAEYISEELAGRNPAALSLRERSAAFPVELAERLVLMYSAQGDLVLDPFGGLLTTSAAALACGRNSVSVEIEADLLRHGLDRIAPEIPALNLRVAARLSKHKAWAADYASRKPQGLRHQHEYYDFPVMTLQETSLRLLWIAAINGNDDGQGGREIRAKHRVYQA